MRGLARFGFPLAVVWMFATPLGAEVLTVGPREPFTEIQPAIDAAQPGDTVLVLPGLYSLSSSLVISKGIHLIGAGSQVTTLKPTPTGIVGPTPPPLVVANLPADQAVQVAGFLLADIATFLQGSTRLVIENCQGPVALSDVAVLPDFMPQLDDLAEPGAGMVRVEGSAQVLFDRCVIPTAGPPQPLLAAKPLSHMGLNVEGSSVFLNSCAVRGQHGISADLLPISSAGGPAVRLVDSQLRIARTKLVGGVGGGGSPSSNGGPAILAERSVIRVQGGPANALVGGDGGEPIGLGASALVLSDSSELSYPTDAYLVAGLHGTTSLPAGLVTADPTSSVLALDLILPTLSTDATVVGLGGELFLDLSGTPRQGIFTLYALETAPALSLSDILGQLLLPLTQLRVLPPVPLDSAGHGGLHLGLPSNPAASGLTVLFQGLEVGGAFPAFTLPALIAIHG